MLIIAVDFDGTIVEHMYPKIGPPVPGALEALQLFQEMGAKLILWTMRSDGHEGLKAWEGEDQPTNPLSDAVEFCRERGIEFWGVNKNPEQSEWTQSPKAYAHVYIDDAAYGCPLRYPEGTKVRPYVDWPMVIPKVLDIIRQHAD